MATATIPDHLWWDKDMGLPYLPYSFTCTCVLCGKTKVFPDSKAMMPVTFLQELLRRVFARTPFVFNVLYQMAFFPELEETEASRQPQPVPLFLRGRVHFCLPCSKFVKEHAFQCLADAAQAGPHCNEPSPRRSEQRVAAAAQIASPPPPPPPALVGMHEALQASWDSRRDEWHLRIHVDQDKLYAGEMGRKLLPPGSSLPKCMIPMDLIMHMLHFPNPKRIPEYRMTIRLLNNLSSGSCSSSGHYHHQQQAGGGGGEATAAAAAASAASAAAVPQSQGLQCLYACFLSIPLHILVTQICTGQIQLKGVFDQGTISNRMHLSAFISGGKRRVSRGDNGVACTIRKANHLLKRSRTAAAARTQSQPVVSAAVAADWIGFVPWKNRQAPSLRAPERQEEPAAPPHQS